MARLRRTSLGLLALSLTASLAASVAVCAAQSTRPAPAPARSAPRAYANSAEGLLQLLNSLLVAAKDADPGKLDSLLVDTELPNYSVWFVRTFGPEKGESDSDLYSRTLDQRENEFEKRFQQLARQSGEFQVRKVNDAPRGLESALLQSFRQHVDVYFVSWKSKANPSGAGEDLLPSPYFLFTEGMFRWDTLERITTQSQPAQSEASAPPPPTQSQEPQSQTQSTPSCSDAHAILKRGEQPALPPCPDLPPAADSVPNRSLSPEESLIERARETAFEFSEKLPNFICEEFMSRFIQRGRDDDKPLDVVSAQIIYDDGKESYRNVKIDDRPTDMGMQELGGAWSTGEFASTLLSLFDPATHADFRSGGASSISGFSAQVYDFQVDARNSHWRIYSDSQTLVPAYEGSVWVDPKTARVLRIEMQARNIPLDFPMDTVESTVDYSYVTIGGTSFLLPVQAESLGCERGTNNCSHNRINFRDYHEFTSDFKIGP